MIQKISESKTTTAAGIITTVTGIVISLIPKNVWSTCSEAVFQSNSPAVVGGMVVFGLILTTIGPSLAKLKS